MDDVETRGALGSGACRESSNVTVYSLVARAGPHRANALDVLEFIDRLHRELTNPPDKELTKGHK